LALPGFIVLGKTCNLGSRIAMSLTEQIYQKLMDGLGRGLDCGEVMAKYSGSKGPVYNALGRAIRDASAQVTALAEKRKQIQKEADEAEQKRESLRHEVEEAESNLASLAEKRDELEKQLRDLETMVAEKTDLLAELHNVNRLGFDADSLRQLRDTLTEIGAQCGLRGKEAVSRFFDHLRDYGAVLQVEAELDALRRQIEAKRLEAEEWQAKEEALRRKHGDLRDAISAVRSLRSGGIKVEQIVTWHRVLGRFEIPEEFEQSLAKYGDIAALLKANKEEAEACELRLTQMQGEVEALHKEKAKTEAAIEAIKKDAVAKVKETGETVQKQIVDEFATITKELRAVGKEFTNQLASHSIQLDTLEGKLLQMGQRYEQFKRKVNEYESLKEALESH
jgi:SMC interacting uncharacterized protein involved in chromosome segregation